MNANTNCAADINRTTGALYFLEIVLIPSYSGTWLQLDTRLVLQVLLRYSTRVLAVDVCAMELWIIGIHVCAVDCCISVIVQQPAMDPFHNFMRACAYLFPSGKSDTRNVNKRFLRTNSTFH